MCILNNIIKDNDIEIVVVDYRRKCSYHKRKNQSYRLASLWPGVRCMEAFHIVYPYFLGLLYDAEFEVKPVVLQCPGAENKIIMQLNEYAIKDWSLKLANFMKRVLRPIKATDIIGKIIKVEIIDSQGVCPAGYKKGDFFDFSERDVICPAAFDIIYPNIFRLLRKEENSASPPNFCAYCPSDKNEVKYQVRMICNI